MMPSRNKSKEPEEKYISCAGPNPPPFLLWMFCFSDAFFQEFWDPGKRFLVHSNFE